MSNENLRVVFYYATAKTGFTTDAGYRELCGRLVKSAHKHGYKTVHLTDNDTEGLGDEVFRYDIDPAQTSWNCLYCFYRFTQENDGEFAFLDTDTEILKPLDFFEEDFDVGLTWRPFNPPYNGGVLFGKNCKKFFEDCHKISNSIPQNKRGWSVDQPSYWAYMGDCPPGEYVKNGLKIKVFPCETHNYTPEKEGEKIPDVYILHLKGPRKHWNVKGIHRS